MPVPVFSVNEVLTSSAMNQVGLWKVRSATFSATTELLLDDIFTADFTNYRVLLEVDTVSADVGINFQFRDGTSNLNTSYYSAGVNVSIASAISKFATNNAAQELAVVGYDTLDYGFSQIEIYRPKETAYTMYSVSCSNYRPTELVENRQYAGAYQQTTTVEGMRFFTGSATTFAGKYFVYGYRN